MLLDFENAVNLLNQWEHFDPEGARVQRHLRAFADYPSDDELRREAEKLILALPQKIRHRLSQLVRIDLLDAEPTSALG